MEPSLFGFIKKYSLRQQVLLTVLTVASFPFLYYSLELPKIIVNKAIQGKHFPIVVMGYTFDQVGYLIALCVLFLILVVINGAFKYWVNVYKGRLGERMLRRLRFQLYAAMLGFPVNHFARHPPGEVIPIITSEVETLGGFVGDSVAVPVFQGGTLITILVFMLMQDWALGLSAIALYPVQFYLIPRLQRKVNALSRERIRLIRQMSDRISESATGLREIRVHATDDWQLAEFSSRLHVNYMIRYRIYRLKFFVKFLNNFFAQLTPFFLLLIGGYLVVTDEISLGSLVAVLAAYKDLGAPWRELLDYYQSAEDSRIKYEQVVAQFAPKAARRAAAIGNVEHVPAQRLDAIHLAMRDEQGTTALEDVSLSVERGGMVALLGPESSGKHELAQAMSALCDPTGGRVTLDGEDLRDLPSTRVARAIAYVGANPVIFAGTLYSNLVFGVQRRPESASDAATNRQIERLEAAMTGNSDADLGADWIDYRAAGATGRADFARCILETLDATDLRGEIRDMGLRGVIDPEAHPNVAGWVLEARNALRGTLEDRSISAHGRLFERFDRERFLEYASLGENIVFGAIIGKQLADGGLARDPYLLEVLEAYGLLESLVQAGVQAARTLVEIFSDMAPGEIVFQRYSLLDPQGLTEMRQALQRLDRNPNGKPTDGDRFAFLSLALRLVPAHHRLGVIDDAMPSRILEARRLFSENLPKRLQNAVEFYDEASYIAALPVQENLLFGRLISGTNLTDSPMFDIAVGALEQAGIRDDVVQAIMEVGLQMPTGVNGSLLGPALRQKLAVARAVLKRPDFLVLDDALSLLDGAAQLRVLQALSSREGHPAIIAVLQRLEHARGFDRVILCDRGKIVEDGSYEELRRSQAFADGVLEAAE